MKKFSARKGFTLVELMIVIAIIGILATVLYPAMTGYFERSRDTNRQAALRNVSLSLSAYNIDNAKYPATPTSTCVAGISTDLVGKYIQAMPKDPKTDFGVSGCETGTNGGYGYSAVKNTNSTASGSYVLAALMENVGNANTGIAWDTLKNTNDGIGSGALANVNRKIAGGTGSTNLKTSLYVVGQ